MLSIRFRQQTTSDAHTFAGSLGLNNMCAHVISATVIDAHLENRVLFSFGIICAQSAHLAFALTAVTRHDAPEQKRAAWSRDTALFSLPL